MTTTITRTFDNYEDAKSAVSELERMGVPHDDISIIANDTDGRHADNHGGLNTTANVDHDGDVDRGATTGAALGGAGGLLAGLGLLAIPGLGPIVAAGWLASTAAGAAIGALGGAATGGIVGALKGAGHSDDEANVYSESVRRGGTLVSARVDDAVAPQAEASLARFNAVDATTRGSAYRADGWNNFDDKAPAYSADEVQRERGLYGNRPVI